MRALGLTILMIASLLVACSPAAPQQETLPTSQPASEIPYPIDQATESSPPIATPLPESYPPPESSVSDRDAEPGGREAVFPNTIIVYQLQGRPVGDWDKWTFYHTGRIVAGDGAEWQVAAEDVKELFDNVEAAEFWELDDAYAPAEECADCPVGTLTVFFEGEIKEIVVTEGALDLPELLNRALDGIGKLTPPQ